MPMLIWNMAKFGTPVLQTQSCTKYAYVNLGHCWVWDIKCTKHDIHVQINIGTFPQIRLCMKCAYVDLGHVMFGTFNVSNPTMSQIRLCSRFDLGYHKLDSEHKSCFGHGYSQIEKFDLGSPKSKCRFGNVPNQIRNKSGFGLQQSHIPDCQLTTKI